MARNLLAESPIETVMPMLVLDAAGEARERTRRAHAVQPLGAGQVHERLVDRERLDLRRQFEHQLAHLAADAHVLRHVGRQHDRVRAELARLEHRHRRMDAVGARDVAGGRDHAALAAADDQRLVGERRVVALLDRGVEGVAIDMRDRERVRVARAGAARGEPQAVQRDCACSASAKQSRQKPAMGSGHLPLPGAAAQHRLRVLHRPAGDTPACAATAISSGSSAAHVVEHAGEERRVPPPPCESSPDRYL